MLKTWNIYGPRACGNRAKCTFPCGTGSFANPPGARLADNLVWLIVDQLRSRVCSGWTRGRAGSSYCRDNELHLQESEYHTHLTTSASIVTLHGEVYSRKCGCWVTKRAADVPGVTELVDEGDVVTIGSVVGKVMLTEGHIDGHISYLFEDVLFCGDTLLRWMWISLRRPPSKMHSSLTRFAACLKIQRVVVPMNTPKII